MGEEKHVLGLAGEGEFFGESSLLGEEFRSMSAEAERDTQLIAIDRIHLPG